MALIPNPGNLGWLVGSAKKCVFSREFVGSEVRMPEIDFEPCPGLYQWF